MGTVVSLYISAGFRKIDDIFLWGLLFYTNFQKTLGLSFMTFIKYVLPVEILLKVHPSVGEFIWKPPD